MNPIIAGLGTTIFDVMSVLARETGAINLGRGFPEWDGPADVREAAARAVIAGPNQYPPMRGLPELRQAVAEHYGRLQGVPLDWRTEVTITSGATEALAAALLAVIEPGDEVVLFEPMYDSYLPMVRRAGGVPRFVRLEAPDWRVREEKLVAAFTDRTRAILLNTPLNPSASVISADDLALIARFCVKHDAIAISDEVWEHVVFDGRAHQTMLAAPDMRDRTIKIGSAGKIFAMTGWKVGFACAAAPLTDAFAKAHQFLTFTTPPHLQSAVAFGLAKDVSHFDAMRTQLQTQRDRLAKALAQESFKVLASEGTYFIGIDLAASGIGLPDHDFAIRACKDHGVATIPYSPFFATAPPTHLIRLCFAKSNDTLDQGVERLAKARRAFA